MNLDYFYRKYLDQDKFLNLRKFMASKMALFASTYLCEKFFSKIGFMKSPYQSVMTDEHLENGLRVASTSIELNLNRVVQKKIQLHISHRIVSTKIKSYCHALIIQLRLFAFFLTILALLFLILLQFYFYCW